MKKKYKFLKDKSVTITKYWHYNLTSNKKNNFIFNDLLKKIVKFFLNKFGLSIFKSNLLFRIEQRSYISSYKILKIRNENVCIFLTSYFSNFGINFKRKSLIQFIKNYQIIFCAYQKNNIDLNGGMGFNNGLILFCILSYLNPKVIIESGVWRGFTTKLIDKATSDDSKILCFDINLSRNKYKSKKTTYYERDITEISKINFQNVDLALFDDHVSHYDRIKFCLLNKIKAVILDDDVGLTQVHSDGWPPIPTASMIYNYNDTPKKFTWVSNNQMASANISGLKVNNIINYYNYIPFPCLNKFTGYKNSSFTTLLLNRSILKQNKY